MIFALRSLSLGLMSIIPNVLPIVMTFGVWGFLVGQVGLAAATVSATALGIVVDDTVHILTKYLRARRDLGYDKPSAIRYAFQTVGSAVFVNSLMLAAGFAFLTLSTFKINDQMGLLTAIAITLAFLVDFFLLPTLLMIGHKEEKETKSVGEVRGVLTDNPITI